jgi:hypothetical protein
MCSVIVHTSEKQGLEGKTGNQWSFPQAHLGGRGGPHEGRAQGPGHLQDNRQGLQHIHKDDKHTRGRQGAVSQHPCSPLGLAKALTHTRDGATTSGGQVSDDMQLPGTWRTLKQQAMHDVTNGKTIALTHSSTKGHQR